MLINLGKAKHVLMREGPYSIAIIDVIFIRCDKTVRPLL